MWQAKFKDGKVVSEFFIRKGLKVEQSFNIVIKNISDLDTLSIVQKSKVFSIRMSDSKFKVIQDTVPFEFYAVSLETINLNKLTNIRPIYFVRETVEFKENNGHVDFKANPGAVNFTALGFQGNIDGQNIKRYLEILPDGTFTIEGI